MNNKTGIREKEDKVQKFKLQKRWEITACVFLFGVAMLIIGVFL